MTPILFAMLMPSALAESPPPAPTPAAPAPVPTTPTPTPWIEPAPAPVPVVPAPTPAPVATPEPAAAEPPQTFSEKYANLTPVSEHVVRHGVRIGYVYANNAEKSSILDSPHLFAMGYEAEFRIASGGPMDVLIVPNIMLLGLNQGAIIPSANLLLGASFNDLLEVGVGGNFAPSESGKVVHMVAAVAVTPAMGELQVPIAFSFIPDNDGDWRLGLTAGVNWGAGK